MSKYLKILTEEKERILNLHKTHFLYELNPNKWGKPLKEAAEIIKPDQDPFAYMKSGDTYYHINVGKTGEKPTENDSRWQQETRDSAIAAIKEKIFSGNSSTTQVTEPTTADKVKEKTPDLDWQKYPCVPLNQKDNQSAKSVTVNNETAFNIGLYNYFKNGTYSGPNVKGNYKCNGDKIESTNLGLAMSPVQFIQ